MKKTCGKCKHFGPANRYGANECYATVKLSQKVKRTLPPCLYLSAFWIGVHKSTRATHCPMWEAK